MKLKTLLIVVGLLAVASLAVYFVNRPTAPTPADPRVGQPLLATDVLAQATRFTLSENGNTVELTKAGEGAWRVASYHDLPADFGKLSRFVNDLTEARIDSFVTSNPTRLDRLEFDDTRIALANGDATLWSVTLGKHADGGGRFIRFGDEQKAFRTRLSAWLDTTSRNWADAALVDLKPEQVARIEVELPDADPIIATRENAEGRFAIENAPEDRQLRASSVNSLLTTLTGIRFNDTSSAGADEVAAAREHQRKVTLTTFDGQTLTIALGRKPEQTIVKPAEATSETGGPASVIGTATEAPKSDEAGPAAIVEGKTETIPAGPVYAFISGPAPLAKLADAPENLAFKVSDYIFTSLPKTRDEWLEPKPAAEKAESGE